MEPPTSAVRRWLPDPSSTEAVRPHVCQATGRTVPPLVGTVRLRCGESRQEAAVPQPRGRPWSPVVVQRPGSSSPPTTGRARIPTTAPTATTSPTSSASSTTRRRYSRPLPAAHFARHRRGADPGPAFARPACATYCSLADPEAREHLGGGSVTPAGRLILITPLAELPPARRLTAGPGVVRDTATVRYGDEECVPLTRRERGPIPNGTAVTCENVRYPARPRPPCEGHERRSGAIAAYAGDGGRPR